MKRRFFAALLCLCLLAATLPTATLAADPHDHTDWTELTAANIAEHASLTDGNYYLGGDINGDFTVDGTVTLCLNGHTLTGTGNGPVITVNSGTFTLTDCSEGETGKVTGGKADGNGVNYGGGVYVEYSEEVYESGGATFILEGGSITGNTASTGGGGVAVGVGNHFIMTGGNITDNTSEWGNGVGVNISRDATFTMSDGTISNNKGTSDEDINGGGVSVNGTFTMTGGAITGNEASLRGGGVYFISGTFTMSGGTISDNTTTNDSGGGVYVGRGNFTMNGGTITGNTAYSSAGGVYVDSDSTFTMSDGTIADNKASNVGAVRVMGKFVMTGGSITGNTSSTTFSDPKCGGVLVSNGGTMEISGTPVIKDNTFSGGTRNIGFYINDPYVTITGPLNTGACIGISANRNAAFTSGYNAQNVSDPSKYFFSDDPSLGVRLNLDGEAELVPGTYTIRYVQQDETTEIDYTLGQDITLEQPDGDGDMGWTLNNGGLTADYAGGATIPGGLGKTPGETITLYAISQSSLATNVELRSNGTYIQWKYVDEGDDAWRDLAALSDLAGKDGADGREVKLQVAEGYIQWSYAGSDNWTNLFPLSALEGVDGKDGITPQLRINPDTNEWEVSYDKGANWVSLQVSATGQDGREVELRNNGTYIQWRYVGEDDNAWRNLAALSDLVGPAGQAGADGQDGQDGADGREVELQVTEGYIQWRYEGGTWSNLLDLSTLTGAAGQDGADGQDGQDGADGQDGQDGADGQDGVTPQLRINAETNQWEVSYDNGTTWDSLGVSATGPAGQDGQDGQDGQTPVIGSNGNWWIGTTDTGISAASSNGTAGSNGSAGKNGEDGADGADGLTPFIGSNGNWWIGSTDTGIPSTGADGQDGQDGQNGQNGAGIADVQINDNGELIVTLTDGTELNAGVVWTEEMAAAMDQGDISSLRTMVYVALTMAGVSLAGLIATLAFLLVKRKIPIGK